MEHGRESQEHAQRQRENGNERASRVEQEQEDHERDDDHLLGQRVPQRADGRLDELRTVVGDDELDTFGQALSDLVHALFDPLDDVEGIFPISHHDDAADGLAFAVEIGDAPSHVGPEAHFPHVAHVDGRAVLPYRQGNDFEVFFLFDVAEATHHLLVAGDLDDAPAYVLVRSAHSRGHVANGDPVGS